VPDSAGEQAATEILRKVKALTPQDLLLVLVSGGGSSLLSLPAEGVSMADLKQVTKQLLHSGAPIQAMNTVRKHLSLIQGGRMAAASRAPVLALVISDVTGDDPTHIASGPCAPDPTTYADAISILERYGVQPPPAIAAHLARGARGEIAETPKAGDRAFAKTENKVIATAWQSLQAAADYFRAKGITPAILGDSVTGEAREVAKVYGAMARAITEHNAPWRPPVALLSLALDLDGAANIHALACDTDGIDGSEDNAGALLMPDALERAARKHINPAALLDSNDAYRFFEITGDLVVTGPTRTNVNDYRVILIS
jgi:hydroxypyruvate reductase